MRWIWVLFLTCIVTSVAKAESDEIGLISVLNGDGNIIFFIDADEGEISNFAAFDEEVFLTSLNVKEDRFYAQARNHLYVGEISSGNILQKRVQVEVMAQEPGEMIDPNQLIYPLGVDKEGNALFSFNREPRELQLQMVRNSQAAAAGKAPPLSETLSLSTKFSKIGTKQPVSMINAHTGKIESLGLFDNVGKRVIGLDVSGKYRVWDQSDNSLEV